MWGPEEQSLEEVSRLKGIETCNCRYDEKLQLLRLEEVSRLKGIETLWSWETAVGFVRLVWKKFPV